MHRLLLTFLLIPVMLFAQDKVDTNKKNESNFPVHSVRTDLFKIKQLSFNKTIPSDSGEILEVEIILENLVDDPMDLYVFTIASYENSYIPKSSFERPSKEDKNPIKLLVPFPNNIKNFEYDHGQFGEKKPSYIKYPKDYKAGVNPDTGKPYLLNEKLIIRTTHLTKYLKKFNFFNEMTVLIFDKDGKLLFRQQYHLNKVKR